MDINNIYENLTGVNIQQQRALWDERGKGYYGEYLLFQELYGFLSGSCKILMNLEIPAGRNKTTEIDLLLIHETGLYVFEVKHYKGTIYGDSEGDIWTQYFRTSKNHCFKNPIKQNSYHISNLKELFPDLPIFSFIVFTNAECDLRIKNFISDIEVCELNSLRNHLNKKISGQTLSLSMEKIDKIFTNLLAYSKINEPITIDAEEKPFIEWLKPFIGAAITEKKKATEQQEAHIQILEKEKAKLKKTKKLGIALNVLIAIICIVLSSMNTSSIEASYNTKLQKNTEELESFKENFLHVDQIDNPFIDELNSYVKVDSVELAPLTDDAISFNATLSLLTDTYRIQFQNNAKYIVITTSGMVFEYDIFDSTLNFNSNTSIMKGGTNKSSKLQEKQFYGINNPDDVEHIKMVNVSVLKNDIQNTVLKKDLEIAIYTKSNTSHN